MDNTLFKLKDILADTPAKSLQVHVNNPAAVLLIVYGGDNGYYLHFQKRSQTVQRHRGEVCFPGGVPDASDSDLQATALREAYEEEGINSEDVTILGQISDVPTRTGYSLKVFVATIPHPYQFTINPDEVQEVLDVPFEHLRNTATWREEARWQKGSLSKSYAYSCGPHIIYGATARIVDQFLPLMEHAIGQGH